MEVNVGRMIFTLVMGLLLLIICGYFLLPAIIGIKGLIIILVILGFVLLCSAGLRVDHMDY